MGHRRIRPPLRGNGVGAIYLAGGLRRLPRRGAAVVRAHDMELPAAASTRIPDPAAEWLQARQRPAGYNYGRSGDDTPTVPRALRVGGRRCRLKRGHSRGLPSRLRRRGSVKWLWLMVRGGVTAPAFASNHDHQLRTTAGAYNPRMSSSPTPPAPLPSRPPTVAIRAGQRAGGIQGHNRLPPPATRAHPLSHRHGPGQLLLVDTPPASRAEQLSRRR